MKIVKSATLLLVVILLFSFSVFNMHPVRVSFYAWESPQLPLFLMLVFAFALGAAVSALWGAFKSAGRGKGAKKAAQGRDKKQRPKPGQEDDGQNRHGTSTLKVEVPEKSEETKR